MNEELKKKMLINKKCEVCRTKATELFFLQGFTLYFCEKHYINAKEHLKSEDK